MPKGPKMMTKVPVVCDSVVNVVGVVVVPLTQTCRHVRYSHNYKCDVSSHGTYNTHFFELQNKRQCKFAYIEKG